LPDYFRLYHISSLDHSTHKALFEAWPWTYTVGRDSRYATVQHLVRSLGTVQGSCRRAQSMQQSGRLRGINPDDDPTNSL
jgi:hypothetical protein